MTEVLLVTIVTAVAIAIVVYRVRHAAAIRRTLREFAASVGLTDLKRTLVNTNELRGLWGGYRVSLLWEPRHSAAPELLITTIHVSAAELQLYVTRRGHEWFERPVTIFGPPLVEPPGANRFWVHTNEPAVAESLFADADLVRLLEENVVDSWDRLELSSRGLRIRRMPGRVDFRPMLESEWALLRRAIDVLGLSPLV